MGASLEAAVGGDGWSYLGGACEVVAMMGLFVRLRHASGGGGG
jgi:hypothetical protein